MLVKSNRTLFWLFALLLAIVGALGLTFLRPTANVARPVSAADASATKQTDPVYEQIQAERELKLRQFFNASIEFYGKVVDENQQPISGASTHYIVASSSFNGSPTLDGPKTDVNGFFAITGKRGPRLTVWVEHPDYYKTDSSHQRVEYAQGEYMRGKEPPPPPTKDNPAIFVLHKKGIAEPLIHHQKIKSRLPLNGNPIRMNVATGERDRTVRP